MVGDLSLLEPHHGVERDYEKLWEDLARVEQIHTGNLESAAIS